MAYKVEFSNRAFRSFQKLPKDVQRQFKPIIDNLMDNPRPDGVTNIKELNKTYRLRVGDYRIIYSIFDDKLIILVLSIADRKDVYSTKEKKILSQILKEWLIDNK
mgnify:CR=1 FL=1